MPHSLLSPGQRYLLGIYGGVGPLSHTAFEQQVLAAGVRRGARGDRDHPVWILVNASSTPDRMTSLSGAGEDVLPYLVHYAKLIERAGADVLFVICNTAHAYHQVVQREIGIPWVHLMKITVDHLARSMPGVKRVGILATDGALSTRLYDRALEERGFTPIAPAIGSRPQQQLMEGLFNAEWGIKATGSLVTDMTRARFAAAAEWMADQGAEAIIAGCTEVSAALSASDCPRTPLVDPLAVAADVAIDIAYGLQEPSAYFAAPSRGPTAAL